LVTLGEYLNGVWVGRPVPGDEVVALIRPQEAAEDFIPAKVSGASATNRRPIWLAELINLYRVRGDEVRLASDLQGGLPLAEFRAAVAATFAGVTPIDPPLAVGWPTIPQQCSALTKPPRCVGDASNLAQLLGLRAAREGQIVPAGDQSGTAIAARMIGDTAAVEQMVDALDRPLTVEGMAGWAPYEPRLELRFIVASGGAIVLHCRRDSSVGTIANTDLDVTVFVEQGFVDLLASP
jgi:hypothetical protein